MPQTSKQDAPPDVTRNLRIPGEMFTQVQYLARAQSRSVSNMLVVLLKEGIRAQTREPLKAAA